LYAKTFSYPGLDMLKTQQDKMIVWVTDSIHGLEPTATNGIDKSVMIQNINKTRNSNFFPTSLTAIGSKAVFCDQ